VRGHDTVARLSGDEFIVVLEDVRGRADAERVLGLLRASFIEPFVIGEFQFLLTASIGLALYPEDGIEPAQLLQRADARMYAVKYPEWVAEVASSCIRKPSVLLPAAGRSWSSA
jgi:diguanylate cyclase (GGDEF)-like protein